MKKKVYHDVAKVKKRISQACIGLLALIFILSLRLSYIMIVKQKEYSAMAEEQWTSEVSIDAKRGRILDGNGVELAVSANVYRVDFDLNSIRDYLKGENAKYKTTKELAEAIAPFVDMNAEDVQKKLETKLPSGKDAGSATLIRRIEKEAADNISALNVNGIIVSADTKRYYPDGTFLAHVLGSTNIDGQGLTGVELKYNDILSGTPGVKITELDSSDRDLPYTISQYTEPVDGKDVTLTIDENIQYFAESTAKQALTEQKAKAVSVLVMDPNTGEILAMANKPDFDPNNPYSGIEAFEGATDGEKLQKMWRNRLVSDTFEPGSIFKVVTAITAMEEGVVSDDDTFVCNGSLKFGNRTIKCWKSGGHGVQHLGDIVQNSCNVGFMELGEKIGKEKLTEYIKKFGFGQLSGIDLPGEAKGIVKSVDNISETDLATISFGQTNTVNSVQYMAAFNAIANGGTWIQPHVMKEVTHEDSNGTEIIDTTFTPTTRTVASSEKSAILREYLERVVTNGSGASTFIEGYHIGGKTGTAQKIKDDGTGYAQGKYISSFVGMAPIDNPKVTVMITVDEPGADQYYAGQVAAPYAKGLFTNIFNYMESSFNNENAAALNKEIVIPEVRGMKVDAAKKVLTDAGLEADISGDQNGIIKTMKPYPGYTVKEGAKVSLYTNDDGGSTNSIVMPDLSGYSEESAKELLNALGLKYTLAGSGVVNNQSVPAGEVITNGTTIKLELKTTIED
ncbi:MAG: stage V sporulation protein D [Clostridium sp.]|uniref:stage V sporulation protein D n=1 Tax=Clostridium sp. DSM 8431 TaxID=1761781 RepID=UPI0008EF3760|nr:stage V sporulation protein D [Clostridium sp. DSM 8431]MCR4943821.1 stage V sporulation protein D [Clostridium sp.]SFU28388.1 stage V sporulation protein D (sporulation-specific penicillin-binding protein) [Clostridium sp. DSM 8431]